MSHRIFVGKDSHKFAAAHMTVFRDGTKEPLHGHNFQVKLFLHIKDASLAGFLNFTYIKEALSAQCNEWDEKLLLAEKCPHFKVMINSTESIEFTLCGKRYVIPTDEVVLLPVDNITTESLSQEFCLRMIPRLKSAGLIDNITLVEVEISESNGQGAIYSLRT